MKIVVLDGYALNPGDLSWESLEQLGDVTIYDRTPYDQVVLRIGDAEFVYTNKTPITREILDACPNIRWIGALSTGYNVIDIQAAKEKGIPVANVPNYSTKAVAQYVFAVMMQITNRIGEHNQSVHNGEWRSCPDFCYRVAPLMELSGKTLGIIGFGAIGKEVARIAKAFDMNILVHSRNSYPQFECETLKFADFDTVVSQSDFLTLHCPLNASTHNLINKTVFAKMKPTAVLINAARGPVVNEWDLFQALKDGIIAYAALDVISVEPMSDSCPLLDAPNCIITPHIAWAALETRKRLLTIAVSNLKSYLEGRPQNIVNP